MSQILGVYAKCVSPLGVWGDFWIFRTVFHAIMLTYLKGTLTLWPLQRAYFSWVPRIF